MDNKPCVKCGQPSLEDFNGHLIAPVNRPYNFCETCWRCLTDEQREEERSKHEIRIDLDGKVWLGNHKLEDILKKCDEVMIIKEQLMEELRIGLMPVTYYSNDMHNIKRRLDKIEEILEDELD